MKKVLHAMRLTTVIITIVLLAVLSIRVVYNTHVIEKNQDTIRSNQEMIKALIEKSMVADKQHTEEIKKMVEKLP